MIICFICFEKFKVLRILFCLYIFCYSCILFYIESFCKLKEVLVGFLCLLCWEFVLVLVVFDKFNKWVKCFFVCDIIGY